MHRPRARIFMLLIMLFMMSVDVYAASVDWVTDAANEAPSFDDNGANFATAVSRNRGTGRALTHVVAAAAGICRSAVQQASYVAPSDARSAKLALAPVVQLASSILDGPFHPPRSFSRI